MQIRTTWRRRRRRCGSNLPGRPRSLRELRPGAGRTTRSPPSGAGARCPGRESLGKPKGIYETLWVSGDGRPTPEAATALGDILNGLLDLRGGESVLVVGLGNRAMTPDAIGPLTADGVLITRHLRQQLPRLLKACGR